MFRTIINRVGNSGSRFAAFVTDEPLEDAPAILLKSNDDGKTDRQTGETGEDDPDEENQKSEPMAELLIYDTIGKSFWGEGGVGENDIAQALKDAGDVKKIRVFINSPGGDAPVGATIYNILTRHPAKVETIIDGLAASAASVIAMAGDKRIARTGSQLMIHPASFFTYGDAKEHEKSAEILRKADDSIATIYAESTGLPVKEINSLVEASTWMTANEALDKGFVDEVQGRSTLKKASVDNQSFVVVNGIKWPSNLFRSTPKNLKSEKKETTPTPSDMEIKNSDDIKRLHPELHKEIFNSGAGEERSRITELDKHLRPELASIVNSAKSDGRKWSDIASECCDILSNALSDTNRSKDEPENKESSGTAEFRAAGAAAVVTNAIREGSDKVAAAEKIRLAQASRDEEEIKMIKSFRMESLNGFNGGRS